MKNINHLGLFDEHILLERLTKPKDPSVNLDAYIDWSIFEPIFDVVFLNLRTAAMQADPRSTGS